MAKKQINLSDVIAFVENLPYAQFKCVVEHYSQKQNSDFSATLIQITTSNFEQRLEQLNINGTCPE
ncbi:TPA: hypothetical protein TXL33_000864 [Streptococcus suis]|nr:hypothetical protein [Streptococcus suis]